MDAPSFRAWFAATSSDRQALWQIVQGRLRLSRALRGPWDWIAPPSEASRLPGGRLGVRTVTAAHGRFPGFLLQGRPFGQQSRTSRAVSFSARGTSPLCFSRYETPFWPSSPHPAPRGARRPSPPPPRARFGKDFAQPVEVLFLEFEFLAIVPAPSSPESHAHADAAGLCGLPIRPGGRQNAGHDCPD